MLVPDFDNSRRLPGYMKPTNLFEIRKIEKILGVFNRNFEVDDNEKNWLKIVFGQKESNTRVLNIEIYKNWCFLRHTP